MSVGAPMLVRRPSSWSARGLARHDLGIELSVGARPTADSRPWSVRSYHTCNYNTVIMARKLRRRKGGMSPRPVFRAFSRRAGRPPPGLQRALNADVAGLNELA